MLLPEPLYLKRVSSSAKTTHFTAARLLLNTISSATCLNIDRDFAQWPASVFFTLILIVGIEGSAKKKGIVLKKKWDGDVDYLLVFSL